MKAALVVLVALAAVLGLSHRAVAAEPSLLDLRTYSLGIGGSYENVTREGESATSRAAANVFAARPLTLFSFVGSATYESTGDLWFRVGVHRRLDAAGEGFAVSLTYDFYALDNVPKYPNEWAASGIWAHELLKKLSVFASETYGLDNHDLRFSAGLTMPLQIARNP